MWMIESCDATHERGWEVFCQSLGFPAARSVPNCCWGCNASPHEGPLCWTSSGSDAGWRHTNRDHGYYLAMLAAKAKPIPVLFTIETLRLVVLSSTEAEYCSTASACKEIVAEKSLFAAFRLEFPDQCPLLVDNQSAIALACGPAAHHQRTKHIGTKYHYQRQLLLDGVVRLQHQATEVMVAVGALSPGPGWLCPGGSVAPGASGQGM